MPRTGRPPKPVEQHKRSGTFRSDRHGSSLAVVAAMALEPNELPPVETLDAVLAAGRAWLAASDSLALALLRESLEERADLRAAVQQGLGDRKALRDLDKQIIGQLSVLGFDPAARSRLGLAEVKARSKLEELRDRQTSGVAASVADTNHAG